MKKVVKLNLNLASSPMKNRRLFFLLFGLLTTAVIVVALLGATIYFRYGSERGDIQETIDDMNMKLNKAQIEEKKFSTRIEDTQRIQANNVDFLNSLIYKKSFSWMDFFTALEESLPESSYIVSLTPYPVDGSTMEVRFEAACADLNDLLKFITQLDIKGFKNINIISESRTNEGFLLSEISVRYVHDV
ncbi:MAG: hypothetical protein JXB23_17800 [Candidatus Aminicenantes bacterium]|nr:hypothetical protein [Candidatus Aminicenantes bacterium]